MAWQHSSKFQQLQILPFAKCQQNGNYWNIFFVIVVNFRIKDKPIATACTGCPWWSGSWVGLTQI